MDLILLTETLVKNVLGNMDAVSVLEVESNDDEIVISICTNEDDMGKLIGKGGKIIKAIRTLVQASAYINDNRKVTINVESK